MNAIPATETFSEGTRISYQTPGLRDQAQQFFEFFGLKLGAPVALLIVAAGCFFIGVVIASIIGAGEKGRRVGILAAAPLAFLLSAVIWLPLLSGHLVSTSIPPLDAFFKWAQGEGELHNQLFLLGIVMLLGAMSLQICQLAMGLLQMALNMVQKFAGKDAPNPEQPAGN